MIDKSNINIVHVCAYYPPHLGGLERVAQISAEGLAERKYQTLVLTSDQSIRGKHEKQKNGLLVKPLFSFNFIGVTIAPTLIWHLLTLPKNSIIHLHIAHAYFSELVMLVSKARRIKYVAHFHLDVGASGGLGLFLIYKRIFWGPVLRGAKKVIACSPDQVEIIHRKYGVSKENITVILNAVSNNFFSNRIYALPEKKLNLLYIGRIAPQKRIERLIETMSKLSIPAHLSIIGDGPERDKLETLVKNLSLHNISFEGKKNDLEMQKYHRENDILLISSDKEGTSLVVLEAMAGGLPIIGTNVAGIQNLLRGVGVLVDEPYAENFAKEIEILWRHPERLLQLSEQSVTKAKQYAWPRFIDQIEQVYREVLL